LSSVAVSAKSGPMRPAFFVYLSFFTLACGSTKFTPTGPVQEPREPNCEFELFTAQPGGKFVEVGTIDVNPGGSGHNVHTDLTSFKQEIRPHVCKLGGDAAFGLANGHGMWIKATVLKRVQDDPAPNDAPAATAGTSPAQPAAATAGTSPEQPTVSAAPESSAGCAYDTQCKGDRICENGKCVNP